MADALMSNRDSRSETVSHTASGAGVSHRSERGDVLVSMAALAATGDYASK